MLHMTLQNMASESGGLLSIRKDTCLQFDHKPQAVVYLPSLSCLIATLSNGTLQVLDIHSGCTLRRIDFKGDGKSTSFSSPSWEIPFMPYKQC